MLRYFITVICLLLLFEDCDQSFNPKGEFESTLAIYAVLSTSDSSALVKVYHTYDPPGFDPFEYTTDPSQTDAFVRIFKENTAYAVRDTMIKRTVSGRYSDSIKAYIASPFPVEFGREYSLHVDSPTYGSFTSSMRMPGKGSIGLSNSYILDNPKVFKNDTLYLYLGISPITRGYMFRGFLEFERIEGGLLVVRRMEVPLFYDKETAEPTYSVVERRITPEGSPGVEGSTNTTIFQVKAFINTAEELHLLYPNSNVVRAVFVLNQIEPNFYNYYSIVNGFRDGNSVRLDEPDFSNIAGGEGVFGGYTVEELSYDLPFGEY